jgi:hypothetical protein
MSLSYRTCRSGRSIPRVQRQAERNCESGWRVAIYPVEGHGLPLPCIDHRADLLIDLGRITEFQHRSISTYRDVLKLQPDQFPDPPTT